MRPAWGNQYHTETDMNLVFSGTHATDRISANEIESCIHSSETVLEMAMQGLLWNETGRGWFQVKEALPTGFLETIQEEAAQVWKKASVMIVIGIGGSNRGAMAAIQALHRSLNSPTRIVWAGDTLSSVGLADVLAILERESVVLNVIAKDFRTLEPGVAFRVLRNAMMKKYGDGYAERIVATGSRGSGQLHELAMEHGYRFLDFPATTGGRFSVLSAVALFPMAVAGIDIRELVQGARGTEEYLKAKDLHSNPAVLYAVTRNLLFSRGFSIESLVIFEPDLGAFARWWTQLFAETEGKTEKALFPVSFSYSEDLHAVGQYVQEGRRCIIETFLGLFHDSPGFKIGASETVKDGFEYLDGKSFDELNRCVHAATLHAHSRDGVPCLEVSAPGISARILGEAFYFFMFSCYVSACLLQVNPFTQDGVENYKKAMYGMLGKKV